MAARSTTPSNKKQLYTSAASSSNGASDSSSNKSILNPLNYFRRTANNLRPRLANDPDKMFLRYTLLTATCLTVALILFKLLRNK